ncbi:MAG TPA: TIGR02757 family protein [Melioribacteraceae bacterium]|nr:TIGR02757 family protein [Melioribacteraceae bacterium]
MTLSDKQLKNKLDYHYKVYNKSRISPDPLEFLHKFTDPKDIEISGIISSTFAFGNIKQIGLILEKLHKIMGKSPFNFIIKFDETKSRQKFKGIYHRFFTTDDIIILFKVLHDILIAYGSLKYMFLMYYFEKDENLKSCISLFSQNILHFFKRYSTITNGLKFMFPDPLRGSACKRINLFLRWMIRKDELDFGLWEEFSTEKLIIPVDTHIAKISKSLGLTKAHTVSWKMAEEITNNLKKFDKNDPVKYDFALCHIGMRKETF